jgi:hypothetical protein
MKRFLGAIVLAVLLAACAPQEGPTPYIEGTPKEIVQKYYAAWAAKDYKAMYALVSNGWKALEPTAHTERDFAKFMSGFYDNARGIRLAFASEQSNTGSEATVSVALEVETLDNRFITSNQTLTLRLKDNGWKLIHPYGEYKDLS